MNLPFEDSGTRSTHHISIFFILQTGPFIFNPTDLQALTWWDCFQPDTPYSTWLCNSFMIELDWLITNNYLPIGQSVHLGMGNSSTGCKLTTQNKFSSPPFNDKAKKVCYYKMVELFSWSKPFFCNLKFYTILVKIE